MCVNSEFVCFYHTQSSCLQGADVDVEQMKNNPQGWYKDHLDLSCLTLLVLPLLGGRTEIIIQKLCVGLHWVNMGCVCVGMRRSAVLILTGYS